MIAAAFSLRAGLASPLVRRRRPGGPGRSRRGRQRGGRQEFRRRRQPDLQDRRGRHGRLVHLSRAIAAITPNATSATAPTARARATRRRLVDSVKRLDLCGVPRGRRQRPPERRPGAAERHAGLRHQPERHVLHRRHLHLSARPRAGRSAARPAGQARRQAGRRRRGGNGVHGQADRRRRRRCASPLAALAARPAPRARRPPGSARRSSSSIRTSSASAPTRTTCRSRTRRRRATRRSSPSSSPRSSARRVSYTYFPQVDRLRAQHARRAQVRRDHGLPAGRRAGAEHQRLLPDRLCAGRSSRAPGSTDVETLADPRLKDKRIGIVARHAAGHQHGDATA